MKTLERCSTNLKNKPKLSRQTINHTVYTQAQLFFLEKQMISPAVYSVVWMYENSSAFCCQLHISLSEDGWMAKKVMQNSLFLSTAFWS